MTPGLFWCATACCIARPSRPRLPYLRKELRGLAAGAPWPCDYGPDLSRGFRALKTWFTLKVYGTAALGSVISRTCALARYLESRIAATPELELLAPVELNVVCFRYRAEDAQRINPRIVIELQESGVVAPSTTILDGRLAIRAAIVNHRTGRQEIDLLVEKTVELGRAMEASAARSRRRVRTAGLRRGAGIRVARSDRAHRGRACRPQPAIRTRRLLAEWAGLSKRETPTSRCWRAIPRTGSR